MLRKLLFISLALAGTVVDAVPYSNYILMPNSRTLHPVSVHKVNGSVASASALTTSAGGSDFNGKSAVTYDFGKNVAGIVSFNTGTVKGEDEYIGISFTESSLWISSDGCDATENAGIDQALWFSVSSNGSYAASKEHQRGAFRYLNVYHNTSGSVELTELSIYFTAVPQISTSGLRAYTGYFHCNDEQLNRIWYAGAYTDQLCTIDPTTGDSLVHLLDVNSSSVVSTPLTWYNNFTIANGSSVLVDGAKRDRLVWPGDMSISTPSVFVSTSDLASVRNALDSLYILQASDGALPYSGIPFDTLLTSLHVPPSFTYHLYSLIALNNYYIFSGDLQYLESHWHQFKLGMNYSLSFLDSTGLANVTSPLDWLRSYMGGHNIEANAILYYTLNLALDLAKIMNDTSQTDHWTQVATDVKSAANSRLWDGSANLYRDNDTLPLTSLHPQDGNSWAIVSNLTDSAAKAANISTSLAARWGKYGAPAPEAGTTVSPFISGFELRAHYLAGQPQRAVKLMKLMWGDFMLDDPRMTNSTFLEGYSMNGDLHYPAYTNDARISHAHGWATAPTGLLTFYAAGLQITAAAGKTWKIEPMLGGLTSVDAGFTTSLGLYSANVTTTAAGRLEVTFEAPTGTNGQVVIQGAAAPDVFPVVNGGKGQVRIVNGKYQLFMTA